jgi:hypothetical protein
VAATATHGGKVQVEEACLDEARSRRHRSRDRQHRRRDVRPEDVKPRLEHAPCQDPGAAAQVDGRAAANAGRLQLGEQPVRGAIREAAERVVVDPRLLGSIEAVTHRGILHAIRNEPSRRLARPASARASSACVPTESTQPAGPLKHH